MGKDKKTPVTVNGKEYMYEELTHEQQLLCNHAFDLDRKIASAQFNIDQLLVGKDAFIKMLEESLNKPVEEPKED